MPFSARRTVPVLRIFDVEVARRFYAGYLGMTVDWEHRFGESFPLYMQVSRDGLVLHLSEHHGDGTPGTVVFVDAVGVRDLHDELTANDDRYQKPGLDAEGPGGVTVTVQDPFGNTLRIAERPAAG